MQEYDYSKLIGAIAEKYRTQAVFAKKIGLSERSVSLKVRGLKAWKQAEISKACEILEISNDDIPKYFFCKKESKSQVN